ncbi:MAG: hypothetical protein NZ561_12490 [Phycisphaerae bacterium]|nr:hypothetical protein [Phycisphaerae bacterium]MDW8263157.1 hypothetical protein [Phycisphaerales bacterium]
MNNPAYRAAAGVVALVLNSHLVAGPSPLPEEPEPPHPRVEPTAQVDDPAPAIEAVLSLPETPVLQEPFAPLEMPPQFRTRAVVESSGSGASTESASRLTAIPLPAAFWPAAATLGGLILATAKRSRRPRRR